MSDEAVEITPKIKPSEDTDAVIIDGRYPDGRIPAPREYIDYDGQLIIRTRYATLQRWKDAGCESVGERLAPYILTSDYCRNRAEEHVMNEIPVNQFTVYYVSDDTTKTYKITE